MKTNDIYKMIEDKVVSQLQNGIIPWRRCYHISSGDLCVSHQSGDAYSPLNQMLLDEPGEYWSFEQAKKEGYHIRKGAVASKIIFWKVWSKLDKTSEEERYDHIPILKYFNVFHESDVEGLPPKLPNTFRNENTEPIEAAEQIIKTYLDNNQDIKMVTSDRIPCFVPSQKIIHMPDKSQFDSMEDYYSTAFHEMTHSTKFALNRPMSHNDDDRAKEELVAEIGAAFLCGHAGIEAEQVIKNNQSYCANWLQQLRNNIKWLVWASSRAEAAYKYIVNNELPENRTDNSAKD